MKNMDTISNDLKPSPELVASANKYRHLPLLYDEHVDGDAAYQTFYRDLDILRVDNPALKIDSRTFKFSYQGHPGVIKTIIRELLWGGVLSSARYTYCEKDDLNSSCNIHIALNNHDDLVKVFSYQANRLQLNSVKETNIYAKLFREWTDILSVSINEKEYKLSIAEILQSAYDTSLKLEPHAIIIPEVLPDDIALWFEDEMEEYGEYAAELKNKEHFDKRHDIKFGAEIKRNNVYGNYVPIQDNTWLLDGFSYVAATTQDLASVWKEIPDQTGFAKIIENITDNNTFLSFYIFRYEFKFSITSYLVAAIHFKQQIPCDDYLKLYLFAILLDYRKNISDIILRDRIIKYLGENNYFLGILTQLEKILEYTCSDGKEFPKTEFNQILKKIADLGISEAQYVLTKMNSGSCDFKSDLFNLAFEHEIHFMIKDDHKIESVLSINSENALEQLSVCSTKGLKNAPASLVQSLMSVDFAEKKWDVSNIEESVKLLTILVEDKKKEAVLAINRLKKHKNVPDTEVQISLSNNFESRLTFWQQKENLSILVNKNKIRTALTKK